MMKRDTQQRRAIRRTIEDNGRPLSPKEVLDSARGHCPGLGIATVYRTIKALAEEGSLAQVDLPGEPPRYEARQAPPPPLPLPGVRQGLRAVGLPRWARGADPQRLLPRVARGRALRPLRDLRGLKPGPVPAPASPPPLPDRRTMKEGWLRRAGLAAATALLMLSAA